MRNTMFFRIGAALVAIATLTLGLAAPTSAQDSSNLSIEDLPGSWVGTGTGFAGTTRATNQMWIRITKTNGFVGTGTQQWRTCKGRMQACQQRSTRGGGWSKPEPVSLALLTNGAIAGADRDGFLSGYVQGDGSMEIVYSEKAQVSTQGRTIVNLFRLVRIS